MSTYAVEIKRYEDAPEMWAVLQSTTDTMYAPTFDSHLQAVVFASYYSNYPPLTDFSELRQMELHFDIWRFFEAHKAPFPPAWIDRWENDWMPDEHDLMEAIWKDRDTGFQAAFREFRRAKEVA